MVKDDRLTAGFEGYLVLGSQVVIYRWSVDQGIPIRLPYSYDLAIPQQFDQFSTRLWDLGRTEGRQCLLDEGQFPLWIKRRIVSIRDNPSHYEHSYTSIINAILLLSFPTELYDLRHFFGNPG